MNILSYLRAVVPRLRLWRVEERQVDGNLECLTLSLAACVITNQSNVTCRHAVSHITHPRAPLSIGHKVNTR
jgi:hypothetical protein